MDYLTWNDAISARFFNENRSGDRVFLYVTKETISEIGAQNSADLEDFVSAVKTGPPWNSRHGWSICQQALQAFDNWRDRELAYPPYLAYLALFALADSIEVEGFSRTSYYPGLRYILGEDPASGGFPSFDKMYELWFDLELWTNEDKKGDLGVFHADILGSNEYVGLPKAQTILTDDERHKLPILFVANGFDPSSPPSERELSHLLARETQHILQPHTKRLLGNRGPEESPAREMLLASILEELENWDGVGPPQIEFGESLQSSHGNLRLAMMLDRTARTVRFFLRCKSNREFPEEGLHFKTPESDQQLFCYEDWQGWSSILSEEETQSRSFDATNIDWRAGLNLIDREHAWSATLSKHPVRVMTSASAYGFDGLLEENKIPQGKSFYLLTFKDAAEIVRKWGPACCKNFCEIDGIQNMPSGWLLFSVERAYTDAIIRDNFGFLAFPSVLRIQLRGGLKVRRSRYFSFALPYIEILGKSDTDKVYCNDLLLQPNPDTGLYCVPNNLRAQRLRIEVRRDNECIRSRTIFAFDKLEWKDIDVMEPLDKFGRMFDGKLEEECIGPIVSGYAAPRFNPEMFLPPSGSRRVFYIGRNPGEVAECPRENIPGSWKPVWAISLRKSRGEAVYCGGDPAIEKPTRERCSDAKHIRLWKEILWYKRKQITFPSQPALRALWKEYKEVAHNVR